MKRFCLILLTLQGFFPLLLAQTITLDFTAIRSDNHWQKLDSVKVTSLNRQWTETLAYPDTVLILHDITPVTDPDLETSPALFPNPFQQKTSLQIELLAPQTVQISLYTLSGQTLARWRAPLETGLHRFTLSAPINGMLLAEVKTGKLSQVLKLCCTEPAAAALITCQPLTPVAAAVHTATPKLASSAPFTPGDNLQFQGFGVVDNVPYDTSLTQAIWQNGHIVFHFPAPVSRACVGYENVTDVEGNSYATVRIGKQCWLRENLKTRHYADGTALLLGNDAEHNHDLPYYYTYQGSDSLADVYGILYSWAAAMRGNHASPDSLVQGICPDGWHIPSDEEWCEMEHALAPQSNCTDLVSYYGIADSLARQLAYPDCWLHDNFTFAGMPGYWEQSPLYFNTSGFSALPAGFYDLGLFAALGAGAYWWTANEGENSLDAYRRYMQMNNAGVNRSTAEKCNGYSIRCILNE